MNTDNNNNPEVASEQAAPVQETTTEVKDCAKLKLNYPQTLKVGLGFAVCMIFWQVYNFVVPLLLEDAFGFSNTIRNLIVGIASAMCIVLLPVFGKFSDKCKSRFGRRTPFIVIGTAITIVAMVLVPVSVQKQLTDSAVVKSDWGYFFQVEDSSITMEYNKDDLADYGINKGDTITRAELLGAWYDLAEKGDYTYLTKATFADLKETHKENARNHFISLYNPSVSNDGLLGVIGTKNYYKNVVECNEIVDGYRVYTIYNGKANTVSVYNSKDGSTKAIAEADLTDTQKATLQSCVLDKAEYDKLSDSYIQYSAYLADACNDHTAANVQAKVNWAWFAFFLIALILIILAQTVIRTPAVSLMPDVTPSPLRSPGNAMINLVGGVGGGIGFLIYTITFLLNLKVSTQYWIIFGVLAFALALVLLLFILLVKEPKWVKECNQICKEYGLPTSDDKPEEKEDKPKENMFKRYGAKKMISFFLILASIFMWFIGYYAIANNMSIYCVKILNVSAGIASIVSGASLVVSAIGFIPVGYMAKGVGRRLSIIFGYALAIVSYILVAACVKRGSESATVIFMVCYMVSGFGLIFANVNTLPMVLELSSPKDIGTFTGIYYIATMSAQTLGPIFGGIVMDNVGGSAGVFIFSAVAVAIAGILMFFVKHGEAPDFVAKMQKRREAKLKAKTETTEA